jgi:hypothetical protein
MRQAAHRLNEWLEETHSARFELCRHFFLRFFDSELVSTPGQFRVVAVGAIAILLSSSLIFVQAYWHKYMALDGLPTPEPHHLATIADALFLVTFGMFVIGLFTTLEWPSLFPGLRDYLALASLPVRLREIFIAKFAALVTFAGVVIIATTFPPSALMPTVSAGRYSTHSILQVPALFISCSLAALFVFFSLVAVQGVLLNLLPTRQIARVSLAMQGVLLTLLLCGLPMVFAIQGLQDSMKLRPDWAMWVPPVWFLGLEQVILGNSEPYALRLARISLIAVASATGFAILMYLWSYRRHRVRLVESATTTPKTVKRTWSSLAGRMIPDSRKLAVFAFITKTLARSPHHRLVLTGFSAVALAVIFESFISLALSPDFRGFLARSRAVREAAISAPLALSLFVLAGFRYLFRLPVEIRANWVFRVNEPGNRLEFLTAAGEFLVLFAVVPVALITLPLEIFLLGPGTGLAAAILCLLPSLILMESLLIRFEKVPFTSSYLPGRRPLVETLLIYGMAVGIYVWILSLIVNWALGGPRSALGLFIILLAIWLKVRKGRLEDLEIGKLEFEELPEPAVQTLSIFRD